MDPEPYRQRTERRAALTVAVALVLLRCAAPLVMERSLDSDQAIVGLMAKHLSEFRTFPLFFYGQNYMLGVQAWIAVPFYWLGGPTPLMLKLPLLLVNVGVVSALIVMLTRIGLRPWLALAATLPLAITTPVMSDALMRPLGAAVEPFAWALALWLLRRRPGWFGAVFCIAVLHREFAVYCAPALAFAQWRARRWWTPREGGVALLSAALVWFTVDLLKRAINIYGPGGGEHASESLTAQSQQLLLWLSVEAYGTRLLDLITRAIPDMFGARAYPMSDYHGVVSQLTVGSAVAGAALVSALTVAVTRLIALRSGPAAPNRDAIAVYLAVIGICATLGYGLNGSIDVHASPLVRYALFVLLLPVGILTAYFLREHRPVFCTTVVALVTIWALATTIDAGRIVREYVVSPPDNPHRDAADYLVREGFEVGRAQYWDAYIVTFLAQERVILASTGKIRISSYQAIVNGHADAPILLERQPCSADRMVSVFCVSTPAASR